METRMDTDKHGWRGIKEGKIHREDAKDAEKNEGRGGKKSQWDADNAD